MGAAGFAVLASVIAINQHTLTASDWMFAMLIALAVGLVTAIGCAIWAAR